VKRVRSLSGFGISRLVDNALILEVLS